MKQAFPSGASDGQAPKRAPVLSATASDPFRIQAEKRAAKLAEAPRPAAMAPPGPANPKFSAARNAPPTGKAFAPRSPLTGAAANAFYNPFAARPAADPPPAPVRAKALKRSTRKLSNGAELSVVPEAKVTEAAFTEIEPARASAAAEAQRAKAKRFGMGFFSNANAAVAVAAAPAVAAPPPEPPPTPAPPPPPISASAIVPAAGATGPSKGATAPAANDTDTSYWPKRSGSGGGGDSSSGNRTFNQDDLMGVLIALGLLLLFAWMWFSNLGKSADDTVAHPQLAAATVPPLKDPFGPGPVDLRPTSPIPEAAPTPPPVIEDAKPVTPQAVAPVIPAPQPSPPTAAAAPAVAPTQEKPLRVYFCTARSSMTAAARKQFDKEIASWKTIVGDKEIVVTGYADTRGASEANVQLSALRADYIADALRAEGLKVTEVDGMGELSGLDDNQNCSNQRRADISLANNRVPASKACAPPPEDEALACAQ